MATDANRIKLLRELLAERILVLDGAFGTFVLGHHLSAEDYGGASLEGCNENVVRTRPDLIREMHDGFLEAGADLIETAQDTLNCKAGLIGIDRAIEKSGVAVGTAVSGTIETMGTLLAGQDIEAFYTSLAHRNLLWMGLNCATGPDFMTDHLRTLAQISRFNVAVVPNAGLPDEEGRYNETPEMLAGKLARFVEQGWINLVGGCCGTTPEHIRL